MDSAYRRKRVLTYYDDEEDRGGGQASPASRRRSPSLLCRACRWQRWHRQLCEGDDSEWRRSANLPLQPFDDAALTVVVEHDHVRPPCNRAFQNLRNRQRRAPTPRASPRRRNIRWTPGRLVGVDNQDRGRWTTGEDHDDYSQLKQGAMHITSGDAASHGLAFVSIFVKNVGHGFGPLRATPAVSSESP